ncbi:ComEC/Rec2 family competence protein, partial [Rhizobium glycinendophyticum]|uniref:ComEC/Rec2 family competence protein n=1 Tax=Rhizobium glycinendophyticum TaxID=2589807 RepID=UPI001ABFDD7D
AQPASHRDQSRKTLITGGPKLGLRAKLLDEENQSFEKFYHNGIAERAGDDPLGPTDESGRYLTDIRLTHEEIKELYRDPNVRGSKAYANLIQTALTSGRVGKVEALHSELSAAQHVRHWMPEFTPGDQDGVSIEVLSPLVERDSTGKGRLRWFGPKTDGVGRDIGKTKNGHSVIIRVAYRGFSLLLGGDLNRPAEAFLLRSYSGVDPDKPLADAVPAASKRFRSDVLKSCHHGGADVTDEFLEAVNPSAFVVSSGDDENYVHPRPDLLGRLGRFGRGKAPLILCTELLRSTRESEDRRLLTKLRRLSSKIEDPGTLEKERAEYRKARGEVENQLAKRNVEVYGAINLRTDGRRLAVAFRMERNRGKDRWHIYWFRHDEARGFIAELDDAG